jgi:hypothetical protein
MIKPNFILSILGLGVITAGNAVFLGTGPTKTGQIVANEFTGTQAQALEGTVRSLEMVPQPRLP